MHRTLQLSVAGSLALPLCLLLSACGDGTTTVASIPPPPVTPAPTPTPTPTPKASVNAQTSWLPSPATREGGYEMIGRLSATTASEGVSSRLLPGGIGLLVTKQGDGFAYGFSTESVALPGGLQGIDPWPGDADGWDFWPAKHYDNYVPGLTKQLFGQRLDVVASGDVGPSPQSFTNDYVRQTVSANLGWLSATFTYDVGYSYVAMGEWSYQVLYPVGVGAAGDSGSLLFVNGDRTPSSGIPALGTATYDARTLFGWVKAPFALVADFGQRTMSASIQQDYRYNPAGDLMDYPLAFGIHVSGSAPFSADGSFNIPLSGTVNWASSYAINTVLPPPPESATGLMNGAFFGPHAEQVGGTFSLDRANGNQLFQDAFVGQRKP